MVQHNNGGGGGGGGTGVTADLFRVADLFRWNFYASGFVPVFEEFSGFVPGVLLRSKTQFGDGSVVRNRNEAQ